MLNLLDGMPAGPGGPGREASTSAHCRAAASRTAVNRSATVSSNRFDTSGGQVAVELGAVEFSGPDVGFRC